MLAEAIPYSAVAPCGYIPVARVSAAERSPEIDVSSGDRGFGSGSLQRRVRCEECLVGERAVAHGGPGIEKLCDWLIARTGATPEVIGVAIEMTQGPVVEALLERGFCVYGINPKQLDRFRDRFTVAGAKDDRRDAHVLADSLRTDRHAFRRLSNDEPVIVKL